MQDVENQIDSLEIENKNLMTKLERYSEQAEVQQFVSSEITKQINKLRIDCNTASDILSTSNLTLSTCVGDLENFKHFSIKDNEDLENLFEQQYRTIKRLERKTQTEQKHFEQDNKHCDEKREVIKKNQEVLQNALEELKTEICAVDDTLANVQVVEESKINMNNILCETKNKEIQVLDEQIKSLENYVAEKDDEMKSEFIDLVEKITDVDKK